MICPICGTQIPDNYKFCTTCGADLSTSLHQTPAQDSIPENQKSASVSPIPTAQPTPMPVMPEKPQPAPAPFMPAQQPAPMPVMPEKPQPAPAPVMPAQQPAPMPVMPEKPQPAPAPVMPAQQQPLMTSAPVQSVEKKSGGFAKILPWILVGLLVIAAGVVGYFGYNAYQKMADERDMYYLQAEDLKSNNDKYNTLQKKYDELEEKYNTDISEKDDQIDDLYDEVLSYEDIIWYAQYNTIGGTPSFGAEPAVICLNVNDPTTSFTLNTHMEGGQISFYTSGYSVSADFAEDSWDASTQILITPEEPGVTCITFSVDDDSFSEFSVLVIVTE